MVNRSLLAVLAGVLLLAALAPAALAQTSTLAVSKSGLQQGTVTSDPPGINCGFDCSEQYDEECAATNQHDACIIWQPIAVDLTTTLPPGFSVSWSAGGCADGQTTCTVSASGTVTVSYFDATPPTGSLSVPAVSRSPVNVQVSASDPQTGIQRVELLVNDVKVAEDTLAPYNFQYTPPADGSRSVRARIFNGDGASTLLPSQTVVVDNAAPSLQVSGSDGQVFKQGTSPSWTFTTTDATSGPPTVGCRVFAGGATPPAFGACSSAAGHTVPGLTEGAYTLEVRSTDGAANSATVARTFVVDGTGAVATIDSGPADGSIQEAGSATFGFSSEAGATFECRVYPAALTPGAFGACSDAGSHTATGFAPGTYSFEVRATDSVGNVGPASKRTFTVSAPATTDPGGGGTPGTGGDGGTNPITVLQRVDSTFRSRWRVSRSRTRFVAFQVRGVPAGGAVTIVCMKGRCPFKIKAVTVKDGKASVLRLFRKRKLRAGTVFDVRVTATNLIGKVVRYSTRKGKRDPRTTQLCLPPAAARPVKC